MAFRLALMFAAALAMSLPSVPAEAQFGWGAAMPTGTRCTTPTQAMHKGLIVAATYRPGGPTRRPLPWRCAVCDVRTF